MEVFSYRAINIQPRRPAYFVLRHTCGGGSLTIMCLLMGMRKARSITTFVRSAEPVEEADNADPGKPKRIGND